MKNNAMEHQCGTCGEAEPKKFSGGYRRICKKCFKRRKNNEIIDPNYKCMTQSEKDEYQKRVHDKLKEDLRMRKELYYG